MTANAAGATFQAQNLALWLNGTPITGIADNAASSPLTNLYMALHTADPGSSGDQSVSEIAYTGYTRAAIARNPASPAWTVSGSNPAQAVPNSNIAGFGTRSDSGASVTASWVTLGTSATVGASSQFLFRAQLSPPIAITSGVTPTITTTSTKVTMD